MVLSFAVVRSLLSSNVSELTSKAFKTEVKDFYWYFVVALSILSCEISMRMCGEHLQFYQLFFQFSLARSVAFSFLTGMGVTDFQFSLARSVVYTLIRWGFWRENFQFSLARSVEFLLIPRNIVEVCFQFSLARSGL